MTGDNVNDTDAPLAVSPPMFINRTLSSPVPSWNDSRALDRDVFPPLISRNGVLLALSASATLAIMSGN